MFALLKMSAHFSAKIEPLSWHKDEGQKNGAGSDGQPPSVVIARFFPETQRAIDNPPKLIFPPCR